MLPSPAGPKDLRSPAFVEKLTKGPVMFMTVLPNGRASMGSSLALWFLFCIVVGVFSAYITGRALPPGSSYLDVFRFAGCTAFMGYALALWQNTIWYKRAWTTTFKSTVDGLVYGMLTAGVFGWLWPAV
jgi:ABC-type transport system involved in multi-copper enzyme maturation permease subunit